MFLLIILIVFCFSPPLAIVLTLVWIVFAILASAMANITHQEELAQRQQQEREEPSLEDRWYAKANEAMVSGLIEDTWSEEVKTKSETEMTPWVKWFAIIGYVVPMTGVVIFTILHDLGLITL